MRGISSLIELNLEESTGSLDENKILSSASEVEPPKKKAARNKTADSNSSKPKAAARKPKSIKQDGPKRITSKTAPAKRKALEECVNGESQPAKKKITDTNTAQSEDELDVSTAAPIWKQDTKPKSKRRAKATEPNGTEDDLGHGAVIAEQSLPREETETPKPGFQQPTTNEHPPAPEQDIAISVHRAASPQRPVKKTVTTSGRIRQEQMQRRAGSVSDTEKGGDPALRRKLGDMTRNFTNIDLKYRNLRNVGILEANGNMEKLRRHCETTTSASNDLISSLKQELKTYMPLAQEARQLQADLQSSRIETHRHESRVTELEGSLSTAQNEIKALQAKLTVARSTTITAETGAARTPGSAIKNQGQVRSAMAGSAEAAQSSQIAQLKEELYSDLTGLIVRNVKRTEAGDAYDCIQTGRNGTLHFKLTVEPEGDGRTTSFEEVEFLYTPLLDSNRDKDMIEILPYYLKEDITFSRHHAAKFYSRVVDALTRKMEED